MQQLRQVRHNGKWRQVLRKSAGDREGGSVADKHLTPEQLAERVGVPVSTVYQWNSRGGGPRFMRIGRYVRYKVIDVQAWEESLYVEQTAG
ncbi:helix-turn-helix domain-containing protein [Nonomuraea sp. NPDC049784]|uniref:helix-turn-helix transcriptional regulator n=1 Tax=Nonomuraea sp. NPDC049784 TaxID=3154361 RepID=UPI00340E955C